MEETRNYTNCAKVENGIVTRVIVCSDVNWASKKIGGNWQPVYDDQSCGIGHTFDGENYTPPFSGLGYELITDRDELKAWITANGLSDYVDMRKSLDGMKDDLDNYYETKA